MNNIFICCCSFQSESEPSPLSRHIRGVVEVGGSKEQSRTLKIKAELDCYQNNYRSGHRGGESDLINRNQMFRESQHIRKSSLQKVMENKYPIGRTTSLDTFIDNPETFIQRACSVTGMKKSKSSSSNRTSKLGQIVERNARQRNFLF